MNELVFLVHEQLRKEGKLCTLAGRAAATVFVGEELLYGETVFKVLVIEAYRKAVHELPAMYGGMLTLELKEGLEIIFADGDQLYREAK